MDKAPSARAESRRRTPLSPFTFHVSLLFSLFTFHILLAQSPPIQDNSFLIEEAYNQEPGVVQHIGSFLRQDGGDWAFGFTQEWPLGGMRHQLSYTIPLIGGEASGTGLGDIGLNYRFQLVGGDGPAHLAPRLTLLLPTGKEELGRGSGGLGIQANLPLSLQLLPQLVTHYNAGLTLVPSALGPSRDHATTIGTNLGASMIWLLRPEVNLMLETVWQRTEAVAGKGRTIAEQTALLSPGVRWAFNFAGGRQVVPGLAYSIGIGPSGGDDSIFLYLSFEHPFRH
jgi:hypothetical protein